MQLAQAPLVRADGCSELDFNHESVCTEALLSVCLGKIVARQKLLFGSVEGQKVFPVVVVVPNGKEAIQVSYMHISFL